MLQSGHRILPFQQFLQRVYIFGFYEAVAPHDVDDVGGVEDVFFFQKLVKFDDKTHALHVDVVGVVNLSPNLLHLIFLHFNEFFQGSVGELAEFVQTLVNAVHPDAVVFHQLIDVGRKNLVQPFFFPVKPETNDIQRNLNVRVVTFCVNLFAEEMNQFVVAVRKLVNLGGDVAELPFSSNFVEIDGKDTGQLLGLFVNR